MFALSLPLLVENILQRLPLSIPDSEVPRGKTRVCWQLGGKLMFDDYIELDPDASVELKKVLQKRYVLSNQTGAGGEATAGLVQRIFNVFRQQDGGEQQSHSDAAKGRCEPETRDVRCVSTAKAGANEREEVVRLLLCVNDGRNSSKLRQWVLHNTNDDRELFIHLQKWYFNERHWFTLRSVQSLSLAQFDVNYSNSTNVYRHELVCGTIPDENLDTATEFCCLCIPPEERVGDDKEYLCSPAPKSQGRHLVPVLGPTMLKGDFLNPHLIAAGQKTALDQIPKRRFQGELKATPDEVATGWGLHIEEDLHWPTIYFCFVVMLLFSSASGIAWSVRTHDIQGAFAVSAFALTLGAMFLGYMALPKT